MQFLWTFALLGASVHLLLQTVLVWGWVRKSPASSAKSQPYSGGISIIIAARNEAHNLPNVLQDVCEQGYPHYEVLVVLDRCSDESEAIVQRFQQRYPQLRYLHIQTTPPNWSPKKYALTQGIAAAQYRWLAFTDADCRLSRTWLDEIAAAISSENISVLLGVGLYQSYAGWLNAFIRYETLQTAWQYIGAARCGMPYMGVGRNIAYQKTFFDAANGFQAHQHRLSGDDDLLINAAANPQQTRTYIAQQSITYSEPMRTWRMWLRQKMRHVSASNAYRPATKWLLLLFNWSFLAFYVGIFGSGVIFPDTWVRILVLYSCRSVISGCLLAVVARKVQQTDLVWRFLWLDIAFFCYIAFIVPIGLLIQPTRWRN